MAHNIRRLRIAKQVSQDAFAVDAGIDRTYVSRIERGLENPTVAVLDRISHALEVPIVELFSVTKDRRPTPRRLKSGRKKNI